MCVCSYLSVFPSSVIFKSPRDGSQVTHLGKQIFPGEADLLVSAYRQSTKEPHSYLLIDLKQSTNDMYRLRSNVDPEKTKIFVSERVETEDVFKDEHPIFAHLK